MCMNDFVKRLYDFMSIYRIFWSQNSHYKYFTDIYRYFTNIFSKIPTHACVKETLDDFFPKKTPKNRRFITNFFCQNVHVRRVLHSCDFSMENSIFFNGKIDIFRFFDTKSAIFPIMFFESVKIILKNKPFIFNLMIYK